MKVSYVLVVFMGYNQTQALFGWGPCPDRPPLDTTSGAAINIDSFGTVT